LSAVAIALVIFVIPAVVVWLALSRALGNPGLDELWDVLKIHWWGQLTCALLFWAMTAFEYWHISRHGFSAPYRWPDLILYSMLGKWRQVWFWGFLGTLFTFVGTWNLVVRILYGKSDDE
jgi:hypothetical protein